MSNGNRARRVLPSVAVVGVGLFLSACAAAPGCGSSAGVGGSGGTVVGALPGNPTGATSDSGYGGASVGAPTTTDSASGSVPCY